MEALVDNEMTQVQAAQWLKGKAYNEYSQGGEDGLIEAILERIGITNRWCFEVGGFDGVSLSNIWRLAKAGWHALYVEANTEAFEALSQNVTFAEHATAVNDYVFPWTIDALLEQAGAPWDLDVGSIDIDEQDFWVWAGMRRFHPRLMIVEFGYGRPVDQVPPLRSQPEEPQRIIQAGKNMINYLGYSKGYLPVAVTLCNILFVRRDLL